MFKQLLTCALIVYTIPVISVTIVNNTSGRLSIIPTDFHSHSPRPFQMKTLQNPPGQTKFYPSPTDNERKYIFQNEKISFPQVKSFHVFKDFIGHKKGTFSSTRTAFTTEIPIENFENLDHNTVLRIDENQSGELSFKQFDKNTLLPARLSVRNDSSSIKINIKMEDGTTIEIEPGEQRIDIPAEKYTFFAQFVSQQAEQSDGFDLGEIYHLDEIDYHIVLKINDGEKIWNPEVKECDINELEAKCDDQTLSGPLQSNEQELDGQALSQKPVVSDDQSEKKREADDNQRSSVQTKQRKSIFGCVIL